VSDYSPFEARGISEGDMDTPTDTDTEIKFRIQVKQKRHEFNDQKLINRNRRNQIRMDLTKIIDIGKLVNIDNYIYKTMS
jgi:hypothetical protein